MTRQKIVDIFRRESASCSAKKYFVTKEYIFFSFSFEGHPADEEDDDYYGDDYDYASSDYDGEGDDDAYLGRHRGMSEEEELVMLSANPQFVTEPQTVRVEPGHTIRLPCQVDKLGESCLFWH